jgi:enamine deaminase RidA (YjgF/YER057c/UK114 family)
MEFLHPKGWPRPKGYSNGVAARGRMIFLSGMVGWDANEKFVSGDLVGQIRQALQNVVAVLEQAGAQPRHIARIVWYVLDKKEYLAAARRIGEVYREVVGEHYPAMTLVQVAALMEDLARVEIEVTAVLPEITAQS